MPSEPPQPTQERKPALTPQARALWARLQVLIWVLVFAGLLSVSLGFAVEKYLAGAAAGAAGAAASSAAVASAAAWAFGFKVAGAAVTALGAVLIYIRSRLGD